MTIDKKRYFCKKIRIMAQLKRSSNQMIAGVAAGYAEYFGIDVTIVRIAFVIAAIMGSIGIWVYLISLIVMPK